MDRNTTYTFNPHEKASYPLDINASYITLACIVILLVWYAPDRYLGSRHRPDLPGPKGWPLVGNSVDVFFNRKRMLMRIHELGSSYGELFSLTMPVWGRAVTINHPGWLEHVKRADTTRYGKGDAALSVFAKFPGKRSAFGSEGAEWRGIRKTTQPIFSVVSFNTHVSQAMNVIMPRVNNLLSSANNQKVQIDWNNMSGRIALEIFCQMALGMETHVLEDKLSALHNKHGLMDATFDLNTISSGRLYNPLWKVTDKLDGTQRRFDTAQKTFFDAITGLVEKRKHELESGAAVNGDDFLSTLLSGSGDEDPFMIRDTLITLLFASRDNTQNSFTWALHELSRSPGWMDKMRAEAIALAPRNGDVVSYADIGAYSIHLAVFFETLRLWPGVPKNARIALEDDVLPAVPEHGLPAVKIRKGEYVLWSDWTIARNPKVWGADAAVFNPGRFLDEKGRFVKPSPPKFHSFGFGPRYCPGAQLATYEFVALFSSILPHFDLSPVENKERTMLDGFTMVMDSAFMVNVKALDG